MTTVRTAKIVSRLARGERVRHRLAGAKGTVLKVRGKRVDVRLDHGALLNCEINDLVISS